MINQEFLKARKDLLKARIRYHRASIKLLRLQILYYSKINQIIQLENTIEGQIEIINYYKNQLSDLTTKLEGQIDMINYYKNQLANLAA